MKIIILAFIFIVMAIAIISIVNLIEMSVGHFFGETAGTIAAISFCGIFWAYLEVKS